LFDRKVGSSIFNFNCRDTLNYIFDAISRTDPVALAVSGGSDSTALLLLFAAFSSSFPELRGSAVFTVDHDLRPTSKHEAQQVAQLAIRLGFKHKTLVWKGQKPRSNTQMQARIARYNLLSKACVEHSIKSLLTAHTQDDQAETFLLALSRGSGIYGLASMQKVKNMPNGITLIRPLLDLPKTALVDYLKERGESWIEDPTNSDVRFARSRIRAVSGALESIPLSNRRLARTAQVISRVVEALDTCVENCLHKIVMLRLGDSVMLDCAGLLQEPEEISLRTLALCLKRVGNRTYVPRMSSLERLLKALRTGFVNCTQVKRTLSDVLVILTWGRHVGTRDFAQLWLIPEPGRDGFGRMTLLPGESGVWRGHLTVRTPQDMLGPCVIRTLKFRDACSLRAGAIVNEFALSEKYSFGTTSIPVSEMPVEVLTSTPGVYVDDRLVSVPVLGLCLSHEWDGIIMGSNT